MEQWNKETWIKLLVAFPDGDVEIRPDGLIYLPHERLRARLNEVFGPGFWRTVSLRDPVAESGELIWYRQLETRDGYKADVVGHAKFIPNNPHYSYGDALETCKSDALTRACKDMGCGLQVWNRDYQIAWVNRYAEQAPMLSGRGKQWRKKGRPPLPGERVSERQQGPDYVPRETLDHANRQHFDSLNPSPAAQRFDKQLTPVSKEEHYYNPDDDEQLRRLHEIEDEVFADDGRE